MQTPITADEVVTLTSELFVPFAATFRTIKLEPNDERFENDAEHSYFLATLGCALAERLDPSLDLGKISQYALVHDLVEVHAGDTTIWAATERHSSKASRESEALRIIKKRYDHHFPWIARTIEDYERLDEPESCFVYALDKIVPYLIMAAVDHQPFPPSKKVYEEKMRIARKKIARYSKLLPLFEDLYNDYNRRPHFFNG